MNVSATGELTGAPLHNSAMPSLPTALEHLVAERYAELAACCRAAGVVMHDDAGVGERVRRLLLASDFAFEALRADPALLTAAGLERLRDPALAAVPARRSGAAGVPRRQRPRRSHRHAGRHHRFVRDADRARAAARGTFGT